MNHGGGVLADDMGLGKTIQTIAFLSAVLHKTSADPAAALLDNVYEQPALLAARRAVTRAAAAAAPVVVAAPVARRYTVLLLVPSSIIKQWAAELETWGRRLSSEFLVGVAHLKERGPVLGA